jgi:hypothetical protein
MSAIRPGLPQTLPPSGGETSSARNAQVAFFRAALNQVQANPIQAAPIQPQTPAASPTPPTPPSPSTDGQPPRIMRPGTYLDIKV